MKWETLKRCVHDFDIILDLVLSDFQVLRALPDAHKHHDDLLRSYADQVRRVVDNWDIRRVSRLRDLFRDYFPKSLRRCALHVDTDAKGDWVVLPTNREQPAC